MWLLLLLLPTAAAQETAAGPDVMVLVHHPYPDDADELGFPFERGRCDDRHCDAFAVRHGASKPFADGIAYPGFVADGTIRIEALANGTDVFDATLAEYEAAVQERLALDTPVQIRVGTRVADDTVRISTWTTATQGVGGGLRMWMALVEDPVHYRPPPALSNGVFEHPFTVRAIADQGPIELPAGQEVRRDASFALDDDWDTDRMRLAVWVEQERDALGTFDPGEVVQAVSHPVSSQAFTHQTGRAVLVEAYSATWCGPCLIGDEALEELGEAHGLPTGRALSDAGTSYLRAPPVPAGVLGLAAAAGFALFALGRLGGGR